MALTQLWPALLWAGPYFALLRLTRSAPDLERAPAERGRALSVIVPARNEAATIETVLRSVLRSTYAPLELVVVDDRSTDATAAIAQRIADEDARVRVVRGAALPDGWFGKPWACEQGFRAATGELLVFTDADTRHEPSLLERAVGAMTAAGADVLSVIARQRCVTLWERLVMPQIWLLLGLRYPPHAVNHATHARQVIANGQFILVPRETYVALGTHAAVRHEVVEDLALAQRTVRAGRKLVLVHGSGLLETRMYHGLRHLAEGWSKNIYLGARRSFPDEPVRRALVPLTLTAAFAFWLLPFAMLAVPGLRGAGALAAALGAGYWALICFGMEIPAAYGLGYPLGAAVALYIVWRSVARGSRGIVWKGRVYDVGERTGVVTPGDRA
jgi:chlorobactene glucosyltransferase